MKHRSTIVLLVLFSSVLAVLGWLNYAEVPTTEQDQVRFNRVLPKLVDVQPGEIRRLEIDRGPSPKSDKVKGRIVVARGTDGNWQMIDPVDTAADGVLIDTLARNLKEMRKSPDAGTITDDPSRYGLDAPEAVISVYARGDTIPTTTLEVGKAAGERLYVRTRGTKGIEVIDSRLMSTLRLPATDWRDKALFHLPSFQVASLTVKEATPGRDLKVERAQSHWRMVSPVKAPAESDKVEGLVAELSALRVVDGPDAFVADDVKDLSPYGLDKPEMTIEIAALASSKVKPQTLLFGKAVPGHPGQVYAKRGDQDDVIRLDTKILRESLSSANSLRSQKALEFLPGRAVRVRFDAMGRTFDLARVGNAWRLLEPVKSLADTSAVQSLLTRLAELKSAEFLEPSKVTDPKLDPPVARVQVWQAEPGGKDWAKTESSWTTDEVLKGEPAADLALGRHDLLRKSVYGKVPGDTSILAFPDNIRDLLPRNEFAYRDRTVMTLQPASVERLTIQRGTHSVSVQAPGSGSSATRWKVLGSADARADEKAITALLAMLSNLRSEGWESDKLGNGKPWGLDAPWLKVTWRTSANQTNPTPNPQPPSPTGSGTLRVGAKTPRSNSYYANIEGDPKVFLLSGAQVAAFEVELRDKTVLAFPPEKAERVVLHWPGRSLAVVRRPTPKGATPDWQPEPGYDPSGVDLSGFVTLVASFNDLQATRFVQDDGPFPSDVGLSPPRLAVSIQVTGEKGLRWLRIGNATADSQVLATTAEGAAGPLFLLPVNQAWAKLLAEPNRANGLPYDVFAPERARPPG